ncbi:ATP-dependent exonuclease [Neisseria shayeganii]|uniref:ATP-dependent exonuclease n=1 Tax=Neisseria shayeganii TaxID=607712 RepID=UPI003144D7F5
MWRISALCAACSLAYLYDRSVPRGFLAFTFAALLRLELHPHLGVLQRSQAVKLWHAGASAKCQQILE